jgi:proline dehydrogenase
MLFDTMQHPWLTRIGISLTRFSLSMRLPVKTIIKKTLFRQFCGGVSLTEAGKTAKSLTAYNVQVILDYGTEGKEEELDFDKTCNNLIDAIKYASNNAIPFVSIKISGIARFTLLEERHRIHDERDLQEWERVKGRLTTICSAAARYKVMVLIDAEETWIQGPVNELADAMMSKHNTTEPLVYNTFQMYSKGSLDFLKYSYQCAFEQGYILGAKLVRGAYMEKEQKRALKLNYPDPIQDTKQNTDEDFDAAVEFSLRNVDNIGLFIGTHNEISCLKAIRRMSELNVPRDHRHIFFSQLYGMSDNISFNLAQEGYNVAKYLPYGPIEEVIPYLMRRAEENTSVAGQTNRELLLINKELQRRRQLASH